MTAADVRSEVGHPIVDADGHFMEFMPLVDDEILTYLDEAGGAALRDRFRAHAGAAAGHRRVRSRPVGAPASWIPGGPCPRGGGIRSRTPEDRATAYLPD